MKLLNHALLLILALLIAGCSQTEPEITVSDVWSKPVELLQSSDCKHENHAEKKSKSPCCAQDEKNSEKPACCANNVNGVVYFKITNSGGQADRLLSATSKIANVIEIHESKMEDGRMSMQKVSTGIEIPAGKTVELKPGGYHVMLIGLKQALKIDEVFELQLEFEKTPQKTLASKVRLY